jgi:probable HAF family extracellular repeat protein
LEALEDRLTPAGYSPTDLGAPDGFGNVTPNALNNAGQVVGLASKSGSLEVDVFLYSNGQWTDLGSTAGFFSFNPLAINGPGQILAVATTKSGQATTTYSLLYGGGRWNNLTAPSGFADPSPRDLNDAGQVVADVLVFDTGVSHPMLYGSGQWDDLGAPAGYSGPLALAIGDAGQALITANTWVGTSPVYHEFLLDNGVWTDLGSPNGGGPADDGRINGAGQVLVNAGHPFLYSNGQWADLGTPAGYSFTSLAGFNDAGQVLVNASTGGLPLSPPHPFLYTNGQWIDLDDLLPPGSAVTLPLAGGLNGQGQIVAAGSDGHAYLLTPQQAAPQATATSLLASTGNVPAGQPVTLTATVASLSGSPDAPPGSVTFLDGSTTLGTVAQTGGTARLIVTLPSGDNHITAQYNGFTLGGAVYNPSASNTVTVTVTGPGSGPGGPGAPAGGAATPIGDMSLFAFGFSPDSQLDLFEVDQAGQVFALPLLSFFGGHASPILLNTEVAVTSLQLLDGKLVGFLVGGNSQTYLMELLAFDSPYLIRAIENMLANHP